MKKTDEIAQFLKKLDSSDAVDALAELVRRSPESETAQNIVEWMSSHEENDPEAAWGALAEELSHDIAYGPTPTEVLSAWISDRDIDTYAGILDEVTFGQTTISYAERALARLERYAGAEEWNNCVDVAGYDQAATDAADPSYLNKVAVYRDGSRLQYNESEHRWYATKQ